MNLEEKYRTLIETIASMNNPQNYYTTFAAFGDSLPDEIQADVRAVEQVSATDSPDETP